jgi:hypothetical protein
VTDRDAELRVLRARLAGLRARLDGRTPGVKAVSPFRVGQVYARAALPAAAGLVFATRPTEVTPPAAEGGVASFAAATDRTLFARVIGGVPAAGDYLLAAGVDYRWEAERRGAAGGGGGGNTLSGCPCTNIPDTLYMHVASAPGSGTNYVFPATLQWQAEPADVGTYSTDNPGYYSTTDFWSSDGLTKFRYLLSCYQGAYIVSGLYTNDSPNGTYPGKFLITTFLPGLPGNTCSPFSLQNGTANSQTFQLQGITVDALGGP